MGINYYVVKKPGLYPTKTKGMAKLHTNDWLLKDKKDGSFVLTTENNLSFRLLRTEVTRKFAQHEKIIHFKPYARNLNRV